MPKNRNNRVSLKQPLNKITELAVPKAGWDVGQAVKKDEQMPSKL